MDASNRPLRPLSSLVFFLRIGRLQAHVHLLVVCSIAVDCVLGTTSIDRHVWAVVPPQRKILFHHAPSGTFLGATEPSAETASEASRTKNGAVKDSPTSRKVRLVRTVTFSPVTQVIVRVSKPAAALRFLQNHWRTAMRYLTVMAQGVMGVIPDQPFAVGVSYFGDKPVHLP